MTGRATFPVYAMKVRTPEWVAKYNPDEFTGPECVALLCGETRTDAAQMGGFARTTMARHATRTIDPDDVKQARLTRIVVRPVDGPHKHTYITLGENDTVTR